MIWGFARSSTFQPIPIFSGSFSGAKVRTSCERNSIFIPPNTACFRPFSAGPFCGFIVNPQTSLCKLSRVCPTFVQKLWDTSCTLPKSGRILPKIDCQSGFWQKRGKKSHLMTLRRPLSVKAFPAAPRFRRKRRCSCRFPSRPTRENAMPERPQTLRHCFYKKYFSADYAQSKAERIFNQFCVSIDIRRHADGAVVGILAIVDLLI